MLPTQHALILDALSRHPSLDWEQLIEIIDPSHQNLKRDGVLSELRRLEQSLLVKRLPLHCGQLSAYEITHLGRARLIGNEAREVFGQESPAEPARPVQVPLCNHREPDESATALLCVDEEELDFWWESLDVELKADCFAGFALRLHSADNSHVYIEPEPEVRIPIHGTVRASEPELQEDSL